MNTLYLVIVNGEGMRAESCAHPLFSKARIEKMNRQKAENARLQGACAELALLCAMKKALGAPKKDAYIYGHNGKPTPVKPEYGAFSLSHAGGAGACAWSPAENIGADIERAERRIDRIDAKIRAAGDDALDALALWCAKESFVKLTGEGLSRSFLSFSVREGHILGTDGETLAHAQTGLCEGFRWAVCAKEAFLLEVIYLRASQALEALRSD